MRSHGRTLARWGKVGCEWRGIQRQPMQAGIAKQKNEREIERKKPNGRRQGWMNADSAGKEWKSACKPGSVVRERTGNHSSGRRVATPLEQPTRKRREPRHGFPIWPCPGWGFACRARCRARGGLLPGVAARPQAHHFNLACSLRPSAVCFLFHFPSPWAELSLGLLRPAVSRHPALRGPDFPPRLRAAVARRTSGTDSTRSPAGRRKHRLPHSRTRVGGRSEGHHFYPKTPFPPMKMSLQSARHLARHWLACLLAALVIGLLVVEMAGVSRLGPAPLLVPMLIVCLALWAVGMRLDAARRELEQLQVELERAQTLGHTGNWSRARGGFEWSGRARRIPGIDGVALTSFEQLLALAAADDRPPLERAWRAAQAGAHYRTEFCVSHPDGERRVLLGGQPGRRRCQHRTLAGGPQAGREFD